MLGDEERVAARIERQSTLPDLDSFVVVLDEAVLTRPKRDELDL